MPISNLNTLAARLQSALYTSNLIHGKATHAHILRTFQTTQVCSFLSDHLVHMYSKLDQPDSALLVLRLAPSRSVVTWSSLISGAVQNGRLTFSLLQLVCMLRDCVAPNDFTFPCVFKASASLQMSFTGKQIHGVVIKVGLITDVFVGCSAFDMYFKTFLTDDALKLFDEMPHKNIVAWNAYISNAVQDMRPLDAIKAFVDFRRSGGVPDSITFCAFLNACADSMLLETGRTLHGFIIRTGFEADTSVANGLIDFYGKCREIGSSEVVFKSTHDRNHVTWCSLIAALMQNHEEEQACEVFARAKEEDIPITEFMLSTVLSACAVFAGYDLGRLVQTLAIKTGNDVNIFVRSALIDMYGKCGCISDAERAFNETKDRNLVTWNSMIGSYAHQGQAHMALSLFQQMVSPNHVTFLCVLSACSRAGEVRLGLATFESMTTIYGIEPSPEHYACVVDLLGRAGLVDDAYEFIKRIPFRPTVSIWGSLLGSCRVHRKPDYAKIAAQKLFELDPEDSGNHVVLSNVLAASGRWEEASGVRKNTTAKGAGYSWITVQNTVHVFRAKDTGHDRNTEIHTMLVKLRREMEELGYVADPNYALYDLEEEERASEVWHHSEKLALAFALITVRRGVPIRIMKNLRICGDCHNAFKFISGIMKREIVVRDNNRFHTFVDGQCSCTDFW